MANEQQKDEIIALESIYNKEEFSYNEINGQYYYTLKIFIPLPSDYYFIYKDTRNAEELEEKIAISHLPPISLFLNLPNDYPSVSPPAITLCCSWLPYSSLKKLCNQFDKLWIDNERTEIIFTWAAFLKDETLEFLGFEKFLDLSNAYTNYRIRMENQQKRNVENISKTVNNAEVASSSGAGPVKNKKYTSKSRRKFTRKKVNKFDRRIIVDQDYNQNPVQMLCDYNENRIYIEFRKNLYTCKICLSDKLGALCTQFIPCLHVFCKECISEYFKVKIEEGAVQDICCPEEKCTSEALNSQIKDLVSPDSFSKYDSTLLNATLASMTDIVYCPRRHCQYPVTKEPDEQMAKCPSCNYVFCLLCKMVYHGIESCKFSKVDKQDLLNKYENASKEERTGLEKQYGKKELQTLIEDTKSEIWIDNNSRNCPHCHAAIEKLSGCNKMTCGRCNTFFCWICSSVLDRNDPYLHFILTDSQCANKLYEGVIPDENDDDDEDDWWYGLNNGYYDDLEYFEEDYSPYEYTDDEYDFDDDMHCDFV